MGFLSAACQLPESNLNAASFMNGSDFLSVLEEADQAAAVPPDAACEVQLQQHGSNNGGRTSGQSDQIINGYWRRAKQVDNTGSLADFGHRMWRARRLRLLCREIDRWAKNGLQNVDHIGSLSDERRALFEHFVASFSARIQRGAGHRKNLATLLKRKPGSDERARTFRGLHNQDTCR